MIDLKILNVIPTYDWELIFHMNDNTHRVIELKDLRKNSLFTESVKHFNTFRFNSKKVVWENGSSIDLQNIFMISKSVELNDIENKSIYIGQKNQAPTEKHELNHIYFVAVYPYSAKPIMIGETIGYGLGASGGCATYTFENFKKVKRWKDHLKKAGCDWAISIIDRDDLDSEQKVFKIIECIRKGIDK
ncbi:hypothetical protein [Winogradskyella vidalii]|uniref:hypothetical protein n=1 Tax=Winogradskyella vidalii TaxID=2615024 RepID=UPI0015CB965A|nr:hypothetical protein [Winogradskyella vidalii]